MLIYLTLVVKMGYKHLMTNNSYPEHVLKLVRDIFFLNIVCWEDLSDIII